MRKAGLQFGVPTFENKLYYLYSRPTSTWLPLVSWTAVGWNASEPCNRTRAHIAPRSRAISWPPFHPGKWHGLRQNTCPRTPSAIRYTSSSSCSGLSLQNNVDEPLPHKDRSERTNPDPKFDPKRFQ